MKEYPRHIDPNDELVQQHIEEVHAKQKEPEAIGKDLGLVQKTLEGKKEKVRAAQEHLRFRRWWNQKHEKHLIEEQNIWENKLEASVQSSIKDLYKNLDRYTKHDDGYWGTVRLFKEALKDQDIQQKIPKSNTSSLGPILDYSDPYSIVGAMTYGRDQWGKDLDKNFIKEVLIWNNEKFQTAKEELRTHVGDMKNRFLGSIEALGNKFPLPVEEVERRIANLKYHVNDGVEMGSRNGTYAISQRAIYLNHFSNIEEMYDSIVHEWIHAAEGKTILYRPGSRDMEFDNQRVGLGFTRYYASEARGSKEAFPIGMQFNWLEEAITEDLALLLRTPKIKVYEEYIVFLNHLSKRGVPKSLFYDAYFEDYKPEDEVRIPKWKELSKVVSEVLKKEGGLMAMNKYASIFRKAQEDGEPQL